MIRTEIDSERSLIRVLGVTEALAALIIPVFYAWDGQASMPRIYTFDDMDELMEGMSSSDYRWEKGYAKTRKGGNLGIYLLGLPC